MWLGQNITAERQPSCASDGLVEFRATRNSAVRTTKGDPNVRIPLSLAISAPPTGQRQMSQPLFRDGLAGAAEFGWEVLQLRQAVAHRQHRLGIVDVNAGGEGQRRERGGEYVD